MINKQKTKIEIQQIRDGMEAWVILVLFLVACGMAVLVGRAK